ncbi:MAG: hypothetical protein KGH62_02075 [Candidatus Micrarchaeota archaeon]|nr:hypothetical protein [Candidatus Micrarchaeota archaeon]
MEEKGQGIKCINVNQFLLAEPIFECCFVCGDKSYAQLYVQEHLYRVCRNCLKSNKNGITTFLKALQNGKDVMEANRLADKIHSLPPQTKVRGFREVL